MDARSAALLLFLGVGQCQPSALSTAKEYQLPALDWKNIQHKPILYVLKSQTISYNADHHTFLCKPHWLSKVKLVPKQSSIKHPTQFGVHPLDGCAASYMSTQECIDTLKQRSDARLCILSSNRMLSLRCFRLSTHSCGGYGKSVFSQLVIKPILLSMHSAKEVWFTAVALDVPPWHCALTVMLA